MTKLTFITDTLSSGGSERVMSVLANELSKQYEVEIICLRSNSAYYQLSSNVKVTYAINYCGVNLFNKLLWLRRFIAANSIVIAFMVPVYVFTLTSLMFSRHRIIVSERNDPDAASHFRRIARKLLLWRAQAIVVQTQNIADKMPAYTKGKLSIIYNPISDKYTSGSALTGIKENLIVSVGRLSPQKNQKMMIDGFKELLKHKPEYRLEIYGEGEIREDIENYINKSNLVGKVLLKGRCNELQHVYNKAKIFVLTSDYEGMSNAMIEALYVGLPVVTTAVSGTEELIVNGENGIVVPIGDTTTYAKAMISILSDENKRQTMAQKAVFIKDKVETNSIMDKWINLINKFH